jgi:hypothetical protein
LGRSIDQFPLFANNLSQSFFASPGGARLRSHFSICSVNILIAASIMESVVLKFCEELAMEFVDVEVAYLPGAKVKLRSYLA